MHKFPFKFNGWKGLWISEVDNDVILDENSGIYIPKTCLEESKKSNRLADYLSIPDYPITFGLGRNRISGRYNARGSDEINIKETKEEEERKEEEKRKLEEEQARILSNPVEIKKILDKYVISQEQAKIDLAIAFSEMYSGDKANTKYQRSNILMNGPTGVGKTKLLETLSDAFDMPLEIVKIGSMTQEGIVGKRFSQVFADLKRKMDKKDGKDPMDNMRFMSFMCGPREEKPSEHNAILYVDEIDKICNNGQYNGNLWGEALQDQLIGVMDQDVIEGVDTSKVLFVGGGAFEGLEKLLNNQSDARKPMGFNSRDTTTDSGYSTQITDEALIEYGMKRELAARFPLKTTLIPLSEQNMLQIFNGAEDSITRRTAEFYDEIKDVKIKFTPAAKKYMAKVAYDKKTGARALNGVVEQVMKPYKFNIEEYRGKEITIGVDDVKRAL